MAIKGKQRTKTPVTYVSKKRLLELLDKAHRLHPYRPQWLGKSFAMEGSFIRLQEKPKALRIFDNLVMILVSGDKTILGDPRIIERIRLAQAFGDRCFFEKLAGAVKKDVGIDARMSKDPAVAVIYFCAVGFLNGDRKCIGEEYRYWETMDIEKLRQAKDPMVDRVEKIKESIIGKAGKGLEDFRVRVKRMAKQLLTTSMPIPTSI